MKRLFGVFRGSRADKRSPEPEFARLKVAVVSDELTRATLAHECSVRDLTPLNYKVLLRFWRPDLVFVESAWHGPRKAWKFKIAAYPDYPERNNAPLRRVIGHARDLGIPCVFWNKEDGVHFDRFIESACLFDTVFTVDENCIPEYRQRMGPDAKIRPLMFAVQPAIHHPNERGPIHQGACFVGSYSHHIHDTRRAWQDMMFAAASDFGVAVFDRNSSRKSSNYRYPQTPWLEVHESVPHEGTAAIYRDYMVSLNVNTVQDSGTMFSRRLVEILACGGVAVTNPSTSVDRYFRDYCDVVHDEAECRAVFDRLRNGLTKADRERALAGADYVLREHTWSHRLAEVVEAVGI